MSRPDTTISTVEIGIDNNSSMKQDIEFSLDGQSDIVIRDIVN